jgi:hypothetical protein
MKLRTNLELLKILRENFDEHFKTGICNLTLELQIESIIFQCERAKLMVYLRSKFPVEQYPNVFGVITYCWERGVSEPRIKFIDELIKELEDRTFKGRLKRFINKFINKR